MTACAWIVLFLSRTFCLSFEDVSTDNLCLNVSDDVVMEVSNVALSSCSVELLSQPCRNSVCAQGTVTLSAVTDFTRDGNRVSFLSTQPAESSPRLWRGYNPPALKVSQILACISNLILVAWLVLYLINICNLISAL